MRLLDFHLLFADTMGFIPVHFSFPDMSIWKPHLRQAFKFPPSTATELFLQAHDITDAAPDGNRFDYLDIINYLKIHLKFHLEIYVFAPGTVRIILPHCPPPNNRPPSPRRWDAIVSALWWLHNYRGLVWRLGYWQWSPIMASKH